MKLLFVARLQQFVKNIIEAYHSIGAECELISDFDRTTAPVSDVIWVDFADNNALLVQDFLTKARKVLRIHSYELYTDIIKRIIPQEWNAIIFVNDHCLRLFTDIHGTDHGNLYVIPNLVFIDRYSIPAKKQYNNKIAMSGYINRKKGIGELLLLASSLPDYEFHVCGTSQEDDVSQYLDENKPDNLYLYPWTDDLPAFFRDKTYYLNTSLRESFCVSMVEAMLCGLRPLCRNWLGAENVYDPEDIWGSIEELKSMLASGSMGAKHYRGRVIDKNDLDNVFTKIQEAVNAVPPLIYLPTLTIAIVQTRLKYMNPLLNSIANQNYPVKVDILNNIDRDKSIGQCYNELADRCDTDWIVYVGDDDVLSEDYIENVMGAYIRRMYKYRGIAGIITGSTTFDDTGRKLVAIAHPTGFWDAAFVRKVRFDEGLVRQVDTDFFGRVSEMSDYIILRLDWIVGYYYRQHDGNISGNKFTEGVNTSQEPVRK